MDLSYSCGLLRGLHIVLIPSFRSCVFARQDLYNHLLVLSGGMWNVHLVEVWSVCVNVAHAHLIVVFLRTPIHEPPTPLVLFLYFSLSTYLLFLNVLIVFLPMQLVQLR